MLIDDLLSQAAVRAGIISHDERLAATELDDALSNCNAVLSEISMQPLLSPGFSFPFVLGKQTELSLRNELGLIDMLAVRLASVWGVQPPAAVVQAAERFTRLSKRENARPVRQEPDLRLADEWVNPRDC